MVALWCGCSRSPSSDMETAGALIAKSESTKAVELLDSLLARQPGNVSALILRSRAKAWSAEADGALRDLSKAVTLSPDSGEALEARGCGFFSCHGESGQSER